METTNHSVLITGGSSGIGRALAQRFWEAGNDVTIIGRDPGRLATTAAELNGIRTIALDIRDRAAVTELPAQLPHVNILINNAAVQVNAKFASPHNSLETIDQEIYTNLVAPLWLTRLFLPQLLQKPAAAVVNVTSALAIVPKQSAPVYCASKAALHSFSQTLRMQLAGTPVSVFELIPALVDTPMTNGRDQPKMPPEAVAAEFWQGFINNQDEIRVGRVKQLLWLNRLLPSVAAGLMREN